MRKLTLLVIALCLLLCGCFGKTEETQPAETTAPVETTESLMIEFTEETETECVTEPTIVEETTEETQPKPQQGGTSTNSGSTQPPATQPPATEPPATEPPATQPPVQESQPPAPTEETPNQGGGIELPDDNWD